MDTNKQEVLREVRYEIRRSCMLCVHGSFGRQSNWGTCKALTYEHQKHSDSKRHLSIHRSGICEDFTKDKDEAVLLLHYAEFGRWITKE